MYYKKLIGEKISLAPVSIEDAEKWTEWLNDLEVAIPLGDEAYTQITIDNMKKDINSMMSSNMHVFSIVDNQSDSAIGRCLLFDVDLINRSAKVGLFIGDKQYWNKGYGKETLMLLLDYVFNLLNLNSVMLGAFSFNERAINCYKSIGFKEIGRRRQSRLIGNKYYDSVLMDMLAEEFRDTFISKFLDDICNKA